MADFTTVGRYEAFFLCICKGQPSPDNASVAISLPFSPVVPCCLPCRSLQRSRVPWLPVGGFRNPYYSHRQSCPPQRLGTGLLPLAVCHHLLPQARPMGASPLENHGRKLPATFLSNQLLFSYLQCGGLYRARKVFDKMCVRNAHSWNTMIASYAKFGKLEDAQELFDVMLE